MKKPISEVWLGDNMEYMAKFEDGFFDLAIVDPPYGINAPKMQMGTNLKRHGNGQYPAESTASKLRKGRLNSGGGKLKNNILNKSDIDWDDSPPPPEYFTELFRVSQNQIIWGGNYFDLPPTRCIICWDKLQPWDNFSQWEMAWTSFDKPAAMYRFSNTGGANKTPKISPTQKPVPLYKWLLKNYASDHYKILDTHGGSFNSRIAAYEMGFDFYGCEKSKETFEAAKENFKRETRQISMFTFQEQI